ncbi:tail tape measure protein [Sphingomonas sp. RHCKR7]|uniref:tail tape measure protein n=1 Tax=Sphingomonas folli TaxID=2862497 RepID=UPI001CA4E30E|nr:tail tape measure protein [Sphingomonas folli]MBW6528770.1 tail tape measure protein [Sphingomonas folli]
MDEEIERLVIGVRADTAGFARDLDTMRGQVEGPFALGAARAGRGLEHALLEAVRKGKLGMDELRGVAMGAMDAVARAALRDGVAGVTGGGGATGLLTGLLGGLFGLGHGGGGRQRGASAMPAAWPAPGWPPSGGPDGTPTSAPSRRGGLRLAITVNAHAGEAPRALERSARQVARAVRAALEEAE